MVVFNWRFLVDREQILTLFREVKNVFIWFTPGEIEFGLNLKCYAMKIGSYARVFELPPALRFQCEWLFFFPLWSDPFLQNVPLRKSTMLPYQAVAMDYAVTSSFQRLPGPHVVNPAAFSHSWFVPADLCVPFKQNQSLLEPGHVILFIYLSHRLE